MRTWLLIWALALPLAGAGTVEEKLEASIEQKLGRRYVWGAAGFKAYDCSGFVWRAFQDAGVLFKRTTARKLYYSLRPAGPVERSRLGTLVFFDQVHHVGIVRNRQEFYHASSSQGTMRDHLAPYWVRLVSGYRKLNIDD